MRTVSQSKQAIKWIKALLSGKYKQGKLKLGDNQRGFCCWGLGCHITKLDYRPDSGWNYDLGKVVGFLKGDGNINPKFFNYVSLSVINDETNAGFKRIGKYLIKHASTNFNPKVAKAIQKHFKET